MIGKLTKGRGARGLAEYLLGSHDHSGEKRPRVAVLGGTFAGQTPRELAREFGQLHALRPSLGVHVAHVSLRVPADERALSDDDWRQIGASWAEDMGYEGYVVVGHGDHVHVAASRIRLDGSVVSDRQDWARSEAIVRSIEERFGLQRVEASHLLEPEKATTHRRAPTAAEIALAERGVAPAAQVVADAIAAQLDHGPVSVTDFMNRLEERGVVVIPNLSTTGRLSGFAYEYGDERVTAAAIGRGFTLGNMVKRGLEYEQDRDLAPLRARSRGREDDGPARRNGSVGADGPGRERGAGAAAAEPGADRRRSGAPAGAIGAGHGEPDGGDAADLGAGDAAISGRAPAGSDSGQGLDAGSPASSGPVAGGDAAGGGADPAPAGRAARGEGEAAAQPVAPRAVGGHGAAGGGPVARVAGGGADDPVTLDGQDDDAAGRFLRRWAAAERRKQASLAQIATGGGHPPPSLGSGGKSVDAGERRQREQEPPQELPAMPQPTRSPAPGPAVQRVQALAGLVPSNDRTLDQVRRQLAAFGCDLYEFQPLPPKGSDLPKERIRRADAAGVERSLGWLKRMNMQGYDIYIRPAAPDGHAAPFVFVDDIGSDVVQRLEADALPLAVGLESSPGRYHGWVRVGTGPMDRAEVTEAARLVAQRYGGDPSSADWRHYGRLAGFTNRKPERRTPRGQPFAMLRTSSGDVAPAAEALLADARQATEWAERARQRAEQERRSLAAFRGDRRQLEGATAAFVEARERVRTAKEGDQSAQDYGAALALLRRGYTDEQVAGAMREASPHAAHHRSSRDFDYAIHTVAKARATIDSTPSKARAPGPRRR